ncbi:MAG: DNA glycosylase [Methanoregula sp.]|nr:MAG: DNA glycosylase [Methanoregula sp.]
MPVISLAHDEPFSLDLTLSCGQAFRWEQRPDGWWYGVVGNRVIKIRQGKTALTYEGAPPHFIRHYFSLDTDLNAITSSFDRDPFIHEAISNCKGLRLLRQPAWECLISYICATNSNIPMIKRRIANIAQSFGTPLEFEGKTYHAFPDHASLASACAPDLSECKLGYRSPYVLDTACDIEDERVWYDSIASLSYEPARLALMKLQGVGPKAADCILLFAFQKYEAFPVDVWIRRIMRDNYIKTLSNDSSLTGWEYDTIRRFAQKHFGKYCGYAQEYLYAARDS